MTIEFDLGGLSDHVITCLMGAVCDGHTWHTKFNRALREGLAAEEERRSRSVPEAPTRLRIPDDLEPEEIEVALWSVNSAAADFEDMAREAETIATTDLLCAANFCRAINRALAEIMVERTLLASAQSSWASVGESCLSTVN
jgi:hypothetical protein